MAPAEQDVGGQARPCPECNGELEPRASARMSALNATPSRALVADFVCDRCGTEFLDVGNRLRAIAR